MASCKDCLCRDVCSIAEAMGEDYRCSDFKDGNRFIELPCKVGQSVFIPIFSTRKILYFTIVGFVIDDEDISFIINNSANNVCPVSEIGKNVYLTFEEAERALKSLAKSDS